MALDLTEAAGAVGIWGSNIGEWLAEDATRAGRVCTAKPADTHAQPHRMSLPRQVGQGARRRHDYGGGLLASGRLTGHRHQPHRRNNVPRRTDDEVDPLLVEFRWLLTVFGTRHRELAREI
jgi:hypothetical protein